MKNVPNNNGKVGIWGISYPGFYTSASIIDSHPAIVAASPQAPMTNLFLGDDSSSRRGLYACRRAWILCTVFPSATKIQCCPSPKRRSILGRRITTSSFCRLETWPALTSISMARRWDVGRPVQTRHLRRLLEVARFVAAHEECEVHAVLVVGGWYDAEDLEGPYRTFDAIRKFNPETPVTLVEGPWVHGGWARNDGDHLGDVQFNAKSLSLYSSRQYSVPVLRALFEGQRPERRRRRPSFLRQGPTSGAATRNGRRRLWRRRRSTFMLAAS